MQQCRCNREKPPCKYFHPPQHLKDQLLINGRNHLALKNALLTQVPIQPVLPGQLPVATTHPYITSIPTNAMTATTYNPYISQNPNLMPGLIPADPTSAMNAMTCHAMPTSIMSSQKLPRTDRLEVCREFQRGNCKRSENECRFAHPADHVTVDSSDGGMVTVCMDYIKGRCTREQCRYFHPPPHLQAQLKAAQSRANAAAMPQLVETIAVGKKRPREPGDDIFLAFPGMSHYTKRPAMDKSGIPVYQPNTAYQQALAMQLHQPFVPVTFRLQKTDDGETQDQIDKHRLELTNSFHVLAERDEDIDQENSQLIRIMNDTAKKANTTCSQLLNKFSATTLS
ncbi:Muscleblind-like protein 1 [Nymphon striatum]|nr:Muscleblind-like protein 1 [Nymphon striatum]